MSVQWHGLDELREALKHLPADLAADAGAIVDDTAEAVADELRFDYPERTGNLAESVRVLRRDTGQFGVRVQVRSGSKHAWLFEEGSQTRQTHLGWTRGRMPASHLFVKTAQPARFAMYDRLKAMLVAHGLMVTGDAD